MRTYTIGVSDSRTGEITESNVTANDEYPWKIAFTHKFIPAYETSSNDLFNCLVEVRKYLEGQGYLLLCNGSRPNIFCSAMSRQGNGGVKAYVITIGQQADRKDLVRIFDPAERTDVGSVQDQEKFVKSWIDSIRKSK